MKSIIMAEGLTITEEAQEALLDLSGGDMRRVLNVMQAAHMAFPEGIQEESVYLCTGNPLPDHLKLILDLLFNEVVTLIFTLLDLC
jgi:replication factor C subunit 3/5